MENKNSTKTYLIRVGTIISRPFLGGNVKNKNTHGITLIALVITIIILLILAGVVLNLTIGEHGIIKRAEQAGIKYEEAGAREKLELALVDLQAQKVIDSTYNETTYIDSYLTQKQMIVIGDKVTVDGWQFEIDRSVPKIVIGLGKGQIEESTTINIQTAVTNALDYTKATIKIEITSDEDIASIQLNGEEIEVPVKVDGKYIVEKEVSNNGNYIINVKNTKNEYKIGKVQVTEISEDMDIQTAEQLVAFRERVNKGATYEGRTVKLVNDLNLSGICGEEKGNWEPIGSYTSETDTKPFKGTFEGNNYTIDYLYINTTNDYQGLFGYVEKGTIKGIIIGSNSSITGGSHIGGISGFMVESTVQNCGNNGAITSTGDSTGGIIGYMENSNLERCYNKADITSSDTTGGIVGYTWIGQNGEYYLKNSYNEGTVTGKNSTGGITGCIDTSDNNSIDAKISSCYNKGIIIGTEKGRIGGITGRCAGNILIEYCYNLGNINNNNGTNVMNIGGIVGVLRLPEDLASNSEIKSIVNNCYNSANVISTVDATNVGGLVGMCRNISNNNCYVKNCVRLNSAEVKNGNYTATKYGTSSNKYTGKLIGYAYDTNTPYIENVYNETEEYMPTVYNVVNGLSDDASAYWSDADVNAPTLLWEK